MALAVDSAQLYADTDFNSTVTWTGLAMDSGDLAVALAQGWDINGPLTYTWGDSFTQAVKATWASNASGFAMVAYRQNVPTATRTPSYTNAGAGIAQDEGTLLEISGAATTGGPAGTTSGTTASGTTHAVTISGLASGDYIIVGIIYFPSGSAGLTITTDGGQTAHSEFEGGDYGVAASSKIETGVTSLTLTWTTNQSVTGVYAAAVFSALAAASAAPHRLLMMRMGR